MLTDLAIRKLPTPKTGQSVTWDKGLGVKVSPAGTKSFIVKHKNKVKTLGRYPAMSLKQARTAAFQHKMNDTPAKRLDRLSDAVSAYLAECERKNRPATVTQYRLFLSQVKKTRLSDVVQSDIDISSPHAVMVWRVFFNWAIRNELVERNPFAFIKVSWTSRDRVLSNRELRSVWRYTYPPYSDYLKVLILTGQRNGQFKSFEVRGDTLFFPASIMKGKRDHTIPATPYVLELVDRLEPFNGWSKAKKRCDLYSEVRGWKLHDLRRSFSTIHASIGTQLHLTEQMLAHSSGSISGVAATYNRHTYLTEMRSALEKYEEHIQSVVA
ncbi:tyrosine-type recombinase/integrase [Sulfitobacter sp. 1A10445]|uniref:tyrosine-type recombinase/integrase n=1 Tax=unclassified Sulfitobacter TaxID=196795 RepID=UPI0037459D43